MKKWNWSIFWVILILSCIGACGNTSITNLRDGLIIALGFGVPMGLLWAQMTKDDE